MINSTPKILKSVLVPVLFADESKNSLRNFDLSRNFSEFTFHLESIPFEKISTGALRHSLSLRV